VLQATVVDWRSGKDRADPDGNVETGACAATWRCEVKEIVNLAAIAVVDAQETEVALDAELKAAKTAKNAGHADAAGAMVQHSESRAWKAQLGEATEGRGKNRSVAQLEGNVIE
jgi:uncharacterized membrane protein YcjF (UPF0283 family)